MTLEHVLAVIALFADMTLEWPMTRQIRNIWYDKFDALLIYGIVKILTLCNKKAITDAASIYEKTFQ